MSRRAILINQSRAVPARPLPGADVDLARMRRFLNHKIGGAWASKEIESLDNSSGPAVLAALIDAKEVDYALVAFFGHGDHPKGSNVPLETRLDFPGGTQLRVRDLHPGCPRTTMLIDACRVEVETITEAAEEKFGAAEKIAAQIPDRSEYERAFYATLDKCKPHAAYLFACSIGEKAGDHPQFGGLFTRSLLTQAVEWENNAVGINRTQSMIEAFTKAYSLVRKTSTQTPEYVRVGESQRHFPFTVFLG